MEGFGSLDLGRFAEMPMPIPGSNDVIVKVAAAGVNPTDWKEMEGFLGAFYPPYEGPWVPGHDGAGVIEAVGSQVTDYKAGDRVMFISDRGEGRQSGTFCEYAVVNRNFVARAPASIDLVAAATIPVAAATSYQGLFRSDVGSARAGQSAVIHGAAGGLGSFAVAICASKGVATAGTCRAENADYVAALGAERTIDYKSQSTAEGVRAWKPGGADLLLDCVSGGQDLALLDALAPGGRLVVIATTSHDGDVALLTRTAEARGLAAHFFVLDLAMLIDNLNDLSDLIDNHGLKMPEITTFAFEEAGQALERMKQGGTRGKIVLRVADIDASKNH